MAPYNFINYLLANKDVVAKLASNIRSKYSNVAKARTYYREATTRYQVAQSDNGIWTIRYDRQGKRYARVDEVGTLQEAEDMALVLYYSDLHNIDKL